MEIFSHKYPTAKSVHNYRKSTRHPRRYTRLAVGTCALVLFFFISRAMVRRNITNHSLEKKKEPCLEGKILNLPSRVLALKIDNFALKVKPKKICKLNKLKHEKFSLRNIAQFA